MLLSRDTNALLEIATTEAETLKDEFIGIECILIGMTKLEGGVYITELLRKFGVNTNTVLNAMKKIRGNKKVDNKNAEENIKAFEKGVKLVMATDVLVTDDFSGNGTNKFVKINEIPDGFEGVDAGEESRKAFAGVIKSSKTH